MGIHKITRGLDVPLAGTPDQDEISATTTGRVAVLGDDFLDLRARVKVEVGQSVRKGELLAEDARNRALRLTAPGGGTVLAIHRGERRRVLSIVIRLSGGDDPTMQFQAWTGKPPGALDTQQVRNLLIESGVWTAFRTRPFSKVPLPDDTPAAIFVTAMDTRPHAPDTAKVLAGHEEDFRRGLEALLKLTPGTVYVCAAPDTTLSLPDDRRVQREDFVGPHPAGLAGTHIHVLAPAHRERTVWSIHCVDVAAIGRLFAKGELLTERVVSLAGPSVKRPRLLRTRVGAALDDITRDEIADGEQRLVSGSLLGGRIAKGEETGYLGRYHHQVTALAEGGGKEPPAWSTFGIPWFTVTGAFVSAFLPRRPFSLKTSLHGAFRATVPLEDFDSIMPLDILPTPLVRAMSAQDAIRCEQLGCLELDEEDLALCTFVDPGKANWGRWLRRVLSMIEKEG